MSTMPSNNSYFASHQQSHRKDKSLSVQTALQALSLADQNQDGIVTQQELLLARQLAKQDPSLRASGISAALKMLSKGFEAIKGANSVGIQAADISRVASKDGNGATLSRRDLKMQRMENGQFGTGLSGYGLPSTGIPGYGSPYTSIPSYGLPSTGIPSGPAVDLSAYPSVALG